MLNYSPSRRNRAVPPFAGNWGDQRGLGEWERNKLVEGPILVVDDNMFNREGVVMFLRSRGLDTFEAADEASAYRSAQAHRPRAAVVDIVIPAAPSQRAQTAKSLGLNLVRGLKQLDPAMGIVVFSAHEDRGAEIWSMVREGMRGIAYLLKGTRPEHLYDALAASQAGQVTLEQDVISNPTQMVREMYALLTPEERPWVERAVSLIPSLSSREWEVARRIAASHNNLGIAEALGLAQRTIENYVTTVYSRLQLSDVDRLAPALRKSVLLAKACMIYELLEAGKDPGGKPLLS